MIISPLVMLITFAYADTEQQAFKYASKATYKELGIEKIINRNVKRYVHKDVKKYAGYIAPLLQIAIEQKISYEFRF